LCVLSAGENGIEIGNFVHIAIFASLIGDGKITLEDFTGISSRVSIYSSSDDYSGEYMTNPMVPKECKNEMHGNVTICKHAIIGSGSVILPGVRLKEGSAIGALSLVNKDCEEYFIYRGNPAKKIVERSHDLLKKEYLLKN
jgi:galactoside O-acetyltransferase